MKTKFTYLLLVIIAMTMSFYKWPSGYFES